MQSFVWTDEITTRGTFACTIKPSPKKGHGGVWAMVAVLERSYGPCEKPVDLGCEDSIGQLCPEEGKSVEVGRDSDGVKELAQ